RDRTVTGVQTCARRLWPIWLQEVGAPRPFVPQEHAAESARATITHTICGPQVRAVTWWCSHDVSPTLADYPPLEYSLGLIDTDEIGRASCRERRDLTHV